MSKKKVSQTYWLTTIENHALVRAFSFLLALIFSVLLLVNPHIIAKTPETIQHGILSIQMLAICCAFIHGIGFSAETFYFKLLLSPYFHWPVMFSILYLSS